MKLLGISGALRTASVNTLLIRAAAKHLKPDAFEMADINLPLYNADDEAADGIPDSVRKLAEQIDDADAVILSTPEYNQSMSGVIKNALDWISRVEGNPWDAKPIAIMAATAGRSGGGRATNSLRLAMMPFHPLLVPAPEVLLPFARKAFDDDGNLTDEVVDKRLIHVMDRFRAEIASN